MPIDPKKREKAVMKKRRKEKEVARKKHLAVAAQPSPHALIQRAREFPLMGCWISQRWQTGAEGLIQVAVARRQPDGDVIFGTYLIDNYCLGLKNTMCNANFSEVEFRRDILAMLDQATTMESCPPELAHQMIYEGIDYAARFGFKPQKDFKWSHYILTKRGELREPYQLTFGKDGKPFFIAGPYDNARAIVAQLERSAGTGNYDYLVLIDDFPGDL